jgi:hypothetical protein
MERFQSASATFEHAISRARQMVALFEALSALRPNESANDDALRSAYFLAVSSFDFFVHELAAVEAMYRFSNGLVTRNIHLPMNILTVADPALRLATADSHIRQVNSYKAFVDPAKLAELLSCYCSKPWDKLAVLINADLPEVERRSAEDFKGQLND